MKPKVYFKTFGCRTNVFDSQVMMSGLKDYEVTEEESAADILSLHSLAFRLGFVLTGPLVGLLADSHGLSTTFYVLAGFFALALPVAVRNFLRHNHAYS